tara:strand:- start:1383 stop:1793 length:411 start_codon:yes stop_codon:yes gene_type:complete
MVFYFVIGVFVVGDIVLSAMSSGKNLRQFIRTQLLSKVIQLVAIGIHFFVLRLLYSMCYNSLPSREGYKGGEDVDDTNEMYGGEDPSAETMMDGAGDSPFMGGTPMEGMAASDDMMGGQDVMYGGEDMDGMNNMLN